MRPLVRVLWACLLGVGCSQSLFDSHGLIGARDGGAGRDAPATVDAVVDSSPMIDAPPAPKGCTAALGIPGLTAYLPLDEGAGNIAGDLSMAPHNAELFGTAWVPGRIGNGLAFDATTDYGVLASATQLDNLGSMSVCAWVYPGTGTAPYGRIYMALVDKTEMGGTGWSFYLELSSTPVPGWHISFYTNYNDIASGGVVPVARWTHVCATWTGSNVTTGIQFYINGAASPQYQSSDQSSALSSDIGTPVRLASTNNTANSDALKGQLDEVLIFNRAISSQEVSAIFQCAK